MRSLLLILALAAVTALTGQQSKQAPAADAQVYKGVVDQKDEEFVLADADTMQPIATLRGAGFNKDNFARFVGMPVEVRGKLSTEQGAKILTVRRIDDVKPVPAK
jgi:hypothetical protein